MSETGKMTFQPEEQIILWLYFAKGKNHTRGAIVAEMKIILDVKIGSPVADFRGTTQLRDSENRAIVLVVYFDNLLNRVCEMFAIGWGDITERAICDRGSGFGHWDVCCEP